MSSQSLADSYRLARLQPTAETLKLREEPFTTLLPTIKTPAMLDLARVLVGLPPRDGLEWMKEAFHPSDPSFSLIDNAQEVQALAAAILERKIVQNFAMASLAIITATCGGHRKIEIRPDLRDIALAAYNRLSVDRRKHTIDTTKLKAPAKTKTPQELVEHAAAPEIGRAAALLKQVGDEGSDQIRAVATQALSVLEPLAAQVRDLREESEILWWVFGGWSRILGDPFVAMKRPMAAILAGLDLADLNASIVGPVAAPALLHRVLFGVAESENDPVSLEAAINQFTNDDLAKIHLHQSYAARHDLCPITTSLAKAKEIGVGSAWGEPMHKATGIEPGRTMTPMEMAQQAYFERLLLAAGA